MTSNHEQQWQTELTEDARTTSPEIALSRRSVLKTMAIGASASVALKLNACVDAQQSGSDLSSEDQQKVITPPLQWPAGTTVEKDTSISLPASVPQKTTQKIVAGSHNNFYEFLPGRGGFVYPYTDDFKVKPWTIEVTGLCNKPQTFDLDDLFKLGLEERLYTFRCVERWAMNVPWVGSPLSKLLAKVEPKSDAKYVAFVSADRPEQMPGIRAGGGGYQWPYHEALRMDEAMNELSMLVTGMYGQPLLKQNGSPVRIIVPWKYGYKNPKSIVRIELTEKQPKTFWSSGPYKSEYGFLSNVNPNIPHPRWSQSMSYWLGSTPRETFPTPIFNGYGKYVAHLYPDEPTTPQKPLTRSETAR